MRAIVLAAVMAASAVVQAAPHESRTPVEEIRPDTSFIAVVSPIVSRLRNVRYFDAGPHLVGVYGENPLAKSTSAQSVLMYFDKSGQFMVVGSVVEWKKNRNVSAVAVQQFNPSDDLAKAAEIAQKEEAAMVAKYKTALQTDINTQRARLQQSNEKAASRVDALLKDGIPAVEVGTGPKRIVAFVDLTCSHCMVAIRDLLAFVEGNGRSTHTVRFVVTANPKDAQNSNTTAMIYGSGNPLAQLKASMNGPVKYDAALVKAGTPKLTTVQTGIHSLEIRTLPFFVVGSGASARKQTGYGNVQELTK